MKQRLLAHCIDLANNKVNALQEEIASMQQAMQAESKSTAGDKHETGRAMIHLEQEKLHRQLAEARLVLADLEQIKQNQVFDSVQKGSLVQTNRALFLLAVGLGKTNFEGMEIFVISSQSPISKQMLGKHSGDAFIINGTEYAITSVE